MQVVMVRCQLVQSARILDVKQSACLYLCVCRSFVICVCLCSCMQDVPVSCQTACTTAVLQSSMMGWSLLLGRGCACACFACLQPVHSVACLYCPSYRYWSCCLKRTSDFDEFLRQEGCTKGTHRWTGPVVSLAPSVCIWLVPC